MNELIQKCCDIMTAVHTDMRIVQKCHEDDIRGWKAAAARARKNSLALEKLFKQFRKDSCAEASK